MSNRRGDINIDRHGKHNIEDVTRTQGRTKLQWLEERNLGPSSHAMELLEEMFLRKVTSE